LTRYVLFVYDRPGALAALPDDERLAVFAEYEGLGATPGLQGFRLLPPDAATTLRIVDGERVVAPAAAASPGLAGFYLLDGDDPQVAIEVAARIPAARLGGAVEIRPLAGET
jgi:hypothetical protein